jgi:hypothetical protein
MYLLLSFGCAGATNSQSGNPGERPVGTSPITVDEIVNAGLLGSTAHDVVQRLRPSYLIDRTAIRRSTQPISVSVNGGQLSTTNALISIPAHTVQEIRYFTTGEAAARFGSRSEGPVILVMLRTQQPQ